MCPPLREHRQATARLAFLVLVFLEASGCAVTRNLIDTEKRDTYRFDAPFSASDPAFLRSMDTFGNQMEDGNSVEVLENGDGMFPAMLEDIRKARRSVNLEVYIFKDDRAGTMFAEALAAAALRGVKVRLLVDGHGGRLRALGERMKTAGVDVRIYRPIKPWSIHKIGRRTHRKILVVDGRVCYTGGFGIDDRWLGNARDEKEWRDVAVRVTGPVVAQMQAIFGEDWTFTTGEILAGESLYPSTRATGGVLAQAIKVSRGDSTSLSKMLYYVAIRSARKSIHIQNAYFVPDRQVREALKAAARRGVDVRVMVPGPKIDIPFVRAAGRRRYGELLEAGVKIYEYQPTMLHTKMLVVDGIFSTVGSINFDSRSKLSNAEDSFAFYDTAIAARLEAMFQRDLARCRDVSHASWKKRGLDKRLMETLSALGTSLY